MSEEPRVLGGRFKYKTVHEKEWSEQETDKPLTFVCHKGDIQVDSDEHIPMNHEVTTYHGQRVVKINPVAKLWAEHILGFSVDGIDPEDRTDAIAHVIGLTDLPVKLMQTNSRKLPFFFKEPEMFLHPAQQSKVTDWIVSLMNHTDDNGIITFTPENLERNR